ncbi:Protein GVQW1, partial [Plecturocebus cupreus]
MGFHHVSQSGLELLNSIICLPWSPKVLESQRHSCSVAQAGLQWHDLGFLKPLPPGFKFYHIGQADLELLTSGDPPALASQSAGIT